MPKLTCPCGYIHNLSSIPDAGWLTIRDEEFESISTSSRSNDARLDAVHSASGNMYACPTCERIMWSRNGGKDFVTYSREH